ncbi:DUF2671 domain-containing protein [Candidatus Trichorickettsia mobilis]|uniref:DUF2671 domain-containing protein n=1 Tax=Candidatus Trichorickettsia mobilis TaxID=1346319 RepID=UPI0029310433|nr:DUF2671 domain-containing protein [Candidatus Trichorickettsia mobilis]
MKKGKDIIKIKDDILQPTVQSNIEEQWVFSDLKYICSSTGLITESLQKGFDIAQLPNGDIIVTEVKTVNIRYSWDKKKQKMIKLNQE